MFSKKSPCQLQARYVIHTFNRPEVSLLILLLSSFGIVRTF